MSADHDDRQVSVARICGVCGAAYEADVGRLKHGRQTTCSRQCSYAERAKKIVKSIDVACATCGKVTKRRPTQIARSKHGTFCSRACHYAGRSTGASKRVVTAPYRVTEAGRDAWRRSAAARVGIVRVLRLIKCTECGKEFDDPADGRKRVSGKVFCSVACCNMHRVGPNATFWKGGHPEYYGSAWRPMRKLVRKRDGKSCRRCGEATARWPDVHHVKPVRTFVDPNLAHTMTNMVSLCPRCHKHVEHKGMDFMFP